jgi:succinate-semialdehyde dehydrogenase/glutarate-semialdehyde dehydrogenase
MEGYPAPALLIDGEWLPNDGRDMLSVINPATGLEIGQVPVATHDDIDAALAASARGFDKWRQVPAFERAKIMRRIAVRIRENAHSLARILTLEQGKCLSESLQEIDNTADTFEWMAEEGRRAYGRTMPSRTADCDQLVRLEPVGPIAAFSPWNFPAVLAARKVATALAAGCSVILKPAEETPGIMAAIARHCQDAGLPNGVLNLLYGVPADISSRLIESPIIRKASFTGSVQVGRHLATLAAAALKKITLELGGHAPVIVTGDVDVDAVVKLAVAAKFRNAGQLCIAPTRFFVEEGIFEKFVDRFAGAARELKIGPGLDPASRMGPLANARRLAAMQALCDDARTKGARIVTGATSERAAGSGYFWQPTVIADVPHDAHATTQEPFGPIALLNRFSELDDAIERSNALEYGLAAYAFTASLKRAHQLETGLAAGSVSINTFAISPPEMPFSGIKNSGLGYEMGVEGLLEHLHPKAVIRATAL